jgi:hypothetical protein
MKARRRKEGKATDLRTQAGAETGVSEMKGFVV